MHRFQKGSGFMVRKRVRLCLAPGESEPLFHCLHKEQDTNAMNRKIGDGVPLRVKELYS